MDFSCAMDFSDPDDRLSSPDEGGYWPPLFSSTSGAGSVANCPSVWIEPSSPLSLLNRSDFPSYSRFMDACRREDTIEDLLTQQTVLKDEVRELHRQNYLLETDKHKLINELINISIKGTAKMLENCEEEDGNELQPVVSEEDEEPPKPDMRDELIAELQAKLAETQARCGQLEKSNVESSERIFELDIEKQRLNIKLHHYTQITKNLEEVNDELEKELGIVKAEKRALSEKLEKLEQQIERIEEGDFEHVSPDDEAPPVIAI